MVVAVAGGACRFPFRESHGATGSFWPLKSIELIAVLSAETHSTISGIP